MTTSTERPIAPSGFTPNLRVIPGANGGDVAEYITPEASGLESGFYVTDRGLPWHVTLSRRLDTPELMTGSDRTLRPFPWASSGTSIRHPRPSSRCGARPMGSCRP